MALVTLRDRVRCSLMYWLLPFVGVPYTTSLCDLAPGHTWLIVQQAGCT